MKPALVVDNPWQALRRFTPARIALGRSGISQPTAPHLAFQLAHAQARDAVHRGLDVEAIARAIEALGLSTGVLHSAARDRAVYVQRPDLGRRLDSTSAQLLDGGTWKRGGTSVAATGSAVAAESKASGAVSASAPSASGQAEAAGFDLAIVVADGLSALAVERHAAPFIAALLTALGADDMGWRLAPVALVHQGRVAIGDDIGERLAARLVVVLIGERPGLSSPDSLGVYLTWAPRVGRRDAERNCISNVRPQGLAYDIAARRAAHLLGEARRRQLTGVALKDEVPMLEERPGAPALGGQAGQVSGSMP